MQRGYTLVEFMIAMTLSLIVFAALSAALISNMRARDEIDRANQQIENGRYATQVLSDDLQLAGYLGEYDITLGNPATPGAKPDACDTNLATLDAALPLHVQGDDNTSALTCITDRKAGTDVLVIRRVSTCIAGTTNCAFVTNSHYFQASLCGNGWELGAGPPALMYKLNANTSALDLHKRDCTTLADMRRLIVHIYYVANNDASGDGIPTLKLAELKAGAFASTPTPLAHGIENLQFEYGIDTNNDGDADAYTASPDTYGSCAGAACVTNWRNVMSVKMNLLARANTQSSGHTDTKVYALGLDADGATVSVGPFNDRYKRHVFHTVVRLVNPAGRRR